MSIKRKGINLIIETFFPKPKYDVSCLQSDYGFSTIVYIDSYEIFSISFFEASPMLIFRKPLAFKDEFTTLNSIFDLDQVGLFRYDIRGIKDGKEG